MTSFAAQLDAADLGARLDAVAVLREAQLRNELNASLPIGPVLPSYDHIHTTASYGRAVPGVHSVARMIWAAHEARARSVLMVEHESTAHFEEAARATALVNRGESEPLRLALAVEFKAPIAVNGELSRDFSEKIDRAWGQNEAAWVVGVGARPSVELDQLVRQFQEAKRERAAAQLERLNRHLRLDPLLELNSILTPDGNITDRSVAFAVAARKWPEAEGATLIRHSSAVRKMLNPGQPGHSPYPAGLPSFQELTAWLLVMGLIPSFTSQLRGDTLESVLPLLKSWGMRALDVAGIEPSESDADGQIAQFIEMAERHNLLLFGGSDYRGDGTGWTTHETWMDHPLIQASTKKLASYSQEMAH